MVDFDLELPAKQNVVWLPKVLVEALGRKLTITPNSIAAVIYPADADLQDVIQSLEIIKQSLKLKVAVRKVASQVST